MGWGLTGLFLGQKFLGKRKGQIDKIKKAVFSKLPILFWVCN